MMPLGRRREGRWQDEDGAAEGEVDATTDADGGRACRRWFECGPGKLCDVHGCAPDATGACVDRPGICPGLFDPVCGCDGRTYDNDCERLDEGAEGVPLDHAGSCTAGTVAPVCESGRWVDPSAGSVYCAADCAGCGADCRYRGSPDEGWYADCVGPDDGCEPMPPGLIVRADCG